MTSAPILGFAQNRQKDANFLFKLSLHMEIDRSNVDKTFQIDEKLGKFNLSLKMQHSFDKIVKNIKIVLN